MIKIRQERILILVNHDIVIYNFRFELVEYLIRKKFEVHISSPNGERIPELINIGAHFHETSVDRHGTNFINDSRLLFNYYKLTKNIKPDVILSYTIKPNIYGGIISRLTKTPYIPNITGLGKSFNKDSSYFSKKLLKILYNYSVKNASHTFFQNKSNMETFNKLNLLSNSFSVLPGSGVNTKKFSYINYPKNDEPLKLLYIGRLMKDKGINELLEVGKSLRNENVVIDVIGFVDDNKLKNKINLYSDNNYINYHGFKKNVRDYIKNSHAIILPSYHEGMSNVLLEAASSGRPILASNIPGCQETFDEGKSGFGFEPKNVNSMLEAVNKLKNKPNFQRIEMGENGRRKMIHDFERSIIINQYMSKIDELIDDDSLKGRI